MQYSTYFPTTFVVVEFVIVISFCPEVYSGHRFLPRRPPSDSSTTMMTDEEEEVEEEEGR